MPGFTAEEVELDALCAGATRVFERVMEIDGRGTSTGIPKEGSRVDQVERELAEHPFATAPKSTKAAAKAFRSGLTLGDRAWALGAEAFFRSHAAAVGFERIPPSSFRAGHIDTFLPDELAHVAQGRAAGDDADAFLIFTNNDTYDDMGWSAMVVDLRSAVEGLALVQGIPRDDTAKRGSMQVGTDGRSLILTTLDGGARDRSAEEFETFFAAAGEIAARLAPS